MASITTLADIHPDIIHTHILPRLAGTSPSATATISSYLQALCSDDDLFADITKSTWPSVSHPHVDNLISTFPAGHRSFFEDSFPLLITDHHNRRSNSLGRSSHRSLSELISAVDIRFQNDIVYSTVVITDTRSAGFRSSALAIESNNKSNNNRSIVSLQLKSKVVDILDFTNEETLSYLKESVTLSWILIDPTSKRAGNLSSIKPVSARPGWSANEIILHYKTVLPGYDPNEMVVCRIEVVLEGVCDMGLQVQEVVLKIVDMDSICLNGSEVLVIIQGAILAENNVRRKVVDDEVRLRSYKEYKKMKKEKKDRAKKEVDKFKINYVRWYLVCFFIFVYYDIYWL